MNDPRVIVRGDNRRTVARVDQVNRVVAEAKQGRSGPAGSSVTTVINITEPAAEWNLAHYLGRYPSVTTIDNSGDLFEGEIIYHDQNVITVKFSMPVSGTAYLN